jgi:hypothetical protein
MLVLLLTFFLLQELGSVHVSTFILLKCEIQNYNTGSVLQKKRAS